MNSKETLFNIKPVMEGILQHMKRHTGKIKGDTIVTKKVINILIVPTIKIEEMRTRTMKSPSPVKK